MCGLEPLANKLDAFGAEVRTVDGHKVTALADVLARLPFTVGKPSVVIAKTVKGKGISFMENDPKWHHGVPDDRQYELAQQELEARWAEIRS
jgi:transketolase